MQVIAYVGLKCLQGSGGFSGGVLNGLRSFLWIRVQQYTNRSVQVSLFCWQGFVVIMIFQCFGLHSVDFFFF